MIGYREEPDVAPDSTTPTFAALKVRLDNWRWQGVPFYLRSGKRMSRKLTEIAVRFKRTPHLMFRQIHERTPANTLVFNLAARRGHLADLRCQGANPGNPYARGRYALRL